MRQLIKYDLDFSSTFEFVHETLAQVNTLSIELLRLLDFSKGSFFTFFPIGADRKRLHEFPAGKVEQTLFDNWEGYENETSLATVVRNELSVLVLEKIKGWTDFVCVFDDVLRTPTDMYRTDIYESNGVLHKNEIYYLLDRPPISKKLIQDCLRSSNACWHSLCVLASVAIHKSIEKDLSINALRDICLNAEIVVVGAYDGDSYIFWEKS